MGSRLPTPEMLGFRKIGVHGGAGVVYAAVQMRPDDERSGRTGATVRMTVQEAAAALGVTVEAVRGRMHRGKYGRAKDHDGRVFVLVPADQLLGGQPERSTERLGERSTNGRANVQANANAAGPGEELVGRLLDEVAFLRAELADRSEALRRREELHGEEVRRRDHIIAGLVERVPALEAPRDERGGRETAGDEPEGSEPRPADKGAQERTERRSWLHRLFFGE